jgi:MSHA pilin protein MshC
MSLSTEIVGVIKYQIEQFFRVQEGCCYHSRNKGQSGFTLVELVTIIVILGIISAVALPRFFDRNTFESRGFYDQVISTLRYAQKTAVAQHRLVCVAFTVNSITLTIDSTFPPDGVCDAAPAGDLTGPAGQRPYRVTPPSADVTLSGFANFSFNALGSPSFAANQVITVSGYASTPITIERETGFVH